MAEAFSATGPVWEAGGGADCGAGAAGCGPSVPAAETADGAPAEGFAAAGTVVLTGGLVGLS